MQNFSNFKFKVTLEIMQKPKYYLIFIFIFSGVDVMNLLNKLPYLGEQLNNNSLAAGASTFVIAYAIYKAVAPIRMSITIASCPFLVRFLRGKGLLKR